MQFTEDQKKVIETRNKNILVSAAAGSGKTAVLVQRILSRITGKDPIDIDRLLIVTFTSAAAAEMRERIHAALLQAQTEHPEDENLQRQAALIHNAQITTIDSYCMFLLRNHFHEIDLDPSFRIGDPGEIRLLEKDVMQAVLEEAYNKAEPSFWSLRMRSARMQRMAGWKHWWMNCIVMRTAIHGRRSGSYTVEKNWNI